MDRLIPSVEYGVCRQSYAGWSVPMRTIDNHELVMVTQGSGFVQIEKKIIPASAHMLFYFYPHKQHSLWVSSPPYMKFIGVHFSFDGGDGMSKLPIEDVTLPGNYALMEKLFRELIQARDQKEYLHIWQQDLLLSRILYTIMQDRHHRLSPSNLARISAVINHIHGSPCRTFTIEELCEVGRMQKSYLISNFKRVTGHSPIQYATLLKLENSKDQLVSSNKPIREIAFCCGFSSEYYFSRLFSRYYGMSPREFRNRSGL